MTNSRAATALKMLKCGTPQLITIATGIITIDRTTSYIKLDTESAGSTDDLDTINGGSTGDVIYLQSTNGARNVVVKDASGNILVEGGDFTLDTNQYNILLYYDGTNWHTISKAIP